MAEPIDPQLARALDAFTVPDLPTDFTERLVARAMADGGEAAPPDPARPASRRRLRLWLGGVGIVGAGLMSISAAAIGYLGEPLRVAAHRLPGVHHLVERVVPARLRHRALPPAPVVAPGPAAPAPAPVPTPAAALAPAPDALAGQAQLQPRRLIGPPLGAAGMAAAWHAAHPLARPAAARLGLRRAAAREARIAARREAGLAAPAQPQPMPAPIIAPPPRLDPAPPASARPGPGRPWRWWQREDRPGDAPGAHPAEGPGRRRWQRRPGAEGGKPPPPDRAPSPAATTAPAEPPPHEETKPRPAHPRQPRQPHVPRPHPGRRR